MENKGKKSSNKITSFIPIIKTLTSYKKEYITGDLLAGLTTAVMLIPQGMAYAMLGNLPPITGLYASIIPLFVYAILGSSGQLSVGPVAMVSLLVASFLGPLNLSPEEYILHATFLALMIGVLLLLMGLFRLGFLDNFLSHSVLNGFTSAAALIIGTSQLKHLIGINLENHHIIFVTLYEAIKNIGEANRYTVIIGLAAIGIIYGLKKVNKKIPGALIAIIFGVASVYFFNLTEKNVSVVGNIPGGFPPLHVPEFDFQRFTSLLVPALIMGIVGFMESISIAKAIATRTGQKLDANQELTALGSANIAGAFFKAYPVAGGFGRSAVNYEAGANTGIASIITAASISLTVLFLTPYLYYIPRACLAAVIMVAVLGLIDLKGFRRTFKVKKSDGYVLVITFIATLLIGIEQGILTGVIASLALFIWRSVTPHMAVLGKLPGEEDIYRNVDRYEVETWPHIGILRIDASLYFANAKYLETKIMELIFEKKEMKYFILDASGINDVDASAEETLRELVTNLKAHECEFFIAGAKGPVRDVFNVSGFYKFLGEDHFFKTISQAVDEVNSLNSI